MNSKNQFSDGIALCSTSNSAYSYTFLHSVVCLSVTFVHPACTNKQIYLQVQRYTVRWGSLTPWRNGRSGGSNP